VIAETLRYWKVEGSHDIPVDLEIGHIPESNGGQYPGLFLSSQQARMIRPVKYLPLEKEDFVGPFEQPYMSIAVRDSEIVPGESSHVEFDPTNILSIVANMTPFSDFNQSPRNMYQCQMSKQTMGTPGTAIRHRTDSKSYRLQTGQTPVVRSPLYNEYGLDNFPNGTNAIVAVISYTGYDMDDAMIINKSANERGFGYGTVYKVEKVGWEPASKSRGGTNSDFVFGFQNPAAIADLVNEITHSPADWPEDERRRAFRKAGMKQEWLQTVDEDGMPVVGKKVKKGDAIAVYHEITSDPTMRVEHRAFIYKGDEEAYVDEVRLLCEFSYPGPEIPITDRIKQPTSLPTNRCNSSPLNTVSREAPTSVISSPLVTDRRVSCLRSGQP